MRSLLALLFAVLFAASAHAQDRHVSVQLLDGESIEGAVVSMDSTALRVQVGGKIRTIDATRIRACRFEEPAAAQPEPAAPAAVPGPARASRAPERSQDPKPPQDKAPLQGGAQPAPQPSHAPGATPPSDVPHDVRHRSLLRSRLSSLDEAYPWLQPTAPMQWLSIGLLLAILLSLTVHGSVKVAGSEAATLPRSACLGVWYLFSTFVQVAMVPANSLTVVLMLLANPTVALFLMTSLFGLSRVGAIIALAVQLGFAVIGFGALELVTAVLGSITPTST